MSPSLRFALIFLMMSPSFLMAQTDGAPQIGAQVWLESGYSEGKIDTLFRMLADHHMPVARLFIRHGNDEQYDMAFASALKYDVKIQTTLTVPEHPKTREELKRHAAYVEHIVNRYKDHPALETWWLINEPGKRLPSSELAMELFREQLADKYENIEQLNRGWRTSYSSFDDIEYSENWSKTSNLSNTVTYIDWFEFSKDYLTWIQQWIAEEIVKHDQSHPLHTNPAGIFNNLIIYDFPGWKPFLSSLGASIHPSWHFNYLERNQFAMGVAATCEIIKGSSEPNPFWVSELQAGNNIWSGSKPLGPEAEDIAQWTWTSIGVGAEKVIYWLLNNRSKGGESGEWSMLDFHGKPSDRLKMASTISQTINKEKDFFNGSKPIERKVVILLSPESTIILKRKASGGGFVGRTPEAHILSALSYYQAFSELGIPATFKYTTDFDWENAKDCMAIFPNAVAVPEKIVKRAEVFVQNGNKLIIDGLTGYFDEDEVNVLQNNFFFEKLCGANLGDLRTKSNLFTTQIDKVSAPLQAHLWQPEIRNINASVIAQDGDRITAVRNSFGKGEVVWVPMQLGLGAWIDDNGPFAEWLSLEAKQFAAKSPIVFKKKTEHVVMQVLENDAEWVSVLTNGSDQSQEVSLLLNKKVKPKIIFNSSKETHKFDPNKITLEGGQTLVVRWK